MPTEQVCIESYLKVGFENNSHKHHAKVAFNEPENFAK
jgi:hypothetical protein